MSQVVSQILFYLLLFSGAIVIGVFVVLTWQIPPLDTAERFKEEGYNDEESE